MPFTAASFGGRGLQQGHSGGYVMWFSFYLMETGTGTPRAQLSHNLRAGCLP